MKIIRTLLVAAFGLLSLASASAPVLADPGITTAAVNVRAGPGTRYRIIDSIREGTALDIGACRSGWCFVTYGRSKDGWVNQRFIVEFDAPKKKKRRYVEPYDPYDDPFCDRFRPQPYQCDLFPTPIPFPPHPPGPPPDHPPKAPHWPGPGFPKPWPSGGGNPWPKPDWPDKSDWPDKPNFPDRPNFPGFPGGGFCPPALPQCNN